MAGRREYEMLFQLNAQVGGSYSAAFSKAQAQVSAMQQKIVDLGKTQSDIAAYQKQQSAIEATRKKLETLQQQYDNIQKEIGETEGFSSDLENRLLSKKQAIEKTSTALEQQTQKAQQLGAALQNAGVDTNNLASETDRLTAEIQDLKEEQQGVIDQAGEMGSSGAEAIHAMQEAMVASGIQDALKEIYEGFKECTDASIEFESALTGVDKTTDLTEAELAALSSAVKQLSTDIPVTTDEMLGIGEVAGQLGIAKDNLLEFSTVMSMLSTATTMAADEGATMLAQFANITQMDPSKYSNLASAIVALGNSYATTEQKITEMSQGIAASASLAGMSEADMLGISAAVSSLGIESQMGSTAVSKLISTLMTAVETGEGLEEFANIANMTAEEFTQAWGDNAAGALQSFIVGLSDTDRLGQSAIVTLTELGITESRMQRTVLSLSNSGDLLTRTIATANQAWKENTALTQEAEKRYATTASQQQMMHNAFNNLKVAIGDNYTPALRGLYSVTTDVTVAFTEFVEQNPALVRAVTAAIGVVGLATAGLAAYTVGAKLAAAASKLFSASIPGLNVILGVTAGVAALAAGVAALTAIEDSETQQLRELTEASREDYAQIQETQAAYERACAVYGETSQEAQYLAWRVEDLTEAYETNKQTLTEYIEEVQAANESATSLMDANREAYNEVGINEGTTLALVQRLRDLASQTEQTVETQEEMKAIIAELNGIVPELALSYEDVVGGVTDYAAAIEATVKAQAAAQRYEQAQQGMVDAYNEQISAQQRLAELTDQQSSAQARYNAAWAEYQDLVERTSQMGGDNPFSQLGLMFSREYKELAAAEEAYKSYTAQVEETQGVLDQATTEYQDYLDAMVGYVEETTNTTDTTAQLNDRINETIAEMEALAEAYTLAYEAAYQSVTGQYSLWDEAAEVVATSSETITTGLNSQITYWQNYNANLLSLNDRAKDIEGLSDMIASFADGSSDSVNAVAGMATATDEELASMVADWQTLQAEQENVAASIAELNTNFTAEMDALQSELAADIEAMDLGSEAAASGRNTIQGFINGATAMIPQVQAAYARIARVAMNAIDNALDINSPSKEMEWRAEMTWAGYINQTKAMEKDVEQAMAAAAESGVDAASVQVVTFAPELMAALSAYSTPEAAEARYAGYGGSPISVSLSITVEGNATEQTVEALSEYGDEFVDRVRVALAEIEYDNSRRGY